MTNKIKLARMTIDSIRCRIASGEIRMYQGVADRLVKSLRLLSEDEIFTFLLERTKECRFYFYRDLVHRVIKTKHYLIVILSSEKRERIYKYHRELGG